MTAFSPRRVSFPSPHGYMVTSDTERYAVDRPLRDGRIVRIERAWEPVPVADGERDQFVRLRDAAAQRTVALTGSRSVPEEYRADIPAVKPPFWALQVDREARIWIARHVEAVRQPETREERESRLRVRPPNPALEWWEPLVLDVLEPNGRFLGTLRFPNARTNLVFATAMHVWVVELGVFDEAWVVRYRIEPGP